MNYSATELIDRIRNIYNSCDPAEQEVLMQILRELADTGTSPTYEQVWLSDYIEIPVDIDTFLNADAFLGKTNRNGEAVFPFWRKELHSVFGAGNKFSEWILTGATRIGKTSTAITATAYMLYRLMCLRDPQKFFGKKDISKFSILFFNITKDLAKGVAFREFNDTLRCSPWFCLTGDTEVLTPNGYIPIADLVGTDTPVYSYSDRVELVTPDSIILTMHTDKLVKIELEDGTIIQGTPTHRIMLSDGTYKSLADIEEGDDLMEMQKEYFIPLPNYIGMYEISNLGRIKKVGGNKNQYSDMRTYNIHKQGYDSIDVKYNGVARVEIVPELMMKTFYPDYRSDVFYMLGDIHDNSLNNIVPGRRKLLGNWRDVEGTDGVVQVNDVGELYCHTHCQCSGARRRIIPEHYIYVSIDADGYKYVGERILRDLGYHFVHNIVASTFLGNMHGLVVNHKDGDKLNNCVENLEWCTVQENLHHAIATGLCKFKHRKVVELNTNLIFRSPKCAALHFSISTKSVMKSITQKTSVCNGLRFNYYESCT